MIRFFLLLILLLPLPASAALIDNVVSYWKVDESSGNLDDAHSTNDLVNNNTATFSTGIINNGAVTASASNQFFDLDSGSQTGLLPSNSSWTINFWMNASSFAAGTYFSGFRRWVGTTARSYLIYFENVAGTKTAFFYISVDSTAFDSVTPVVTLNTNTWYMWTMVFTANTSIELFQNGTSIAINSTGIPAGTYTGGTGDIAIAGDGTTGDLNGTFDEIGFWNRALSSDEITELYNSGAGFQYPFTVASVVTPILGLVRSFWW